MSAENTPSRTPLNNAAERTTNRRDTARLEAFSDGVFAIAITLLVLNIRVPLASELKDSTLLGALRQQWPAYLAYVVSFVTILLMWVGHHNMFTFIRRIDHTFLLLNGLLLMGVAIVPFPTGLLAEYLPGASYANQQTAAAVAGLTYAFIAVMYDVLYLYAATGQRLTEPALAVRMPWTPLLIYIAGPLLYLVACGLALSPLTLGVKASLAIFVLMVVLYALPVTSQRSGS
jgi:uncharacterized membrane protein